MTNDKEAYDAVEIKLAPGMDKYCDGHPVPASERACFSDETVCCGSEKTTAAF